MIIYVEEDIEYSVGPSVKVVITAATQVTPISSYYLDREVEVAMPYGGLKKIIPFEYREHYFFIYMKGNYFAIPKKSVTIPVSIGWKANV